MAHHKSAKKRIRQTIKRRERNRALRSTLRTEIKKYKSLLEENELDQAQESYPAVQKAIDKAVTKGILHYKTAARYKSRLIHALHRQQAPQAATA